MANYENKRPYNGIEAVEGEQLVPVLAYNLLEWDTTSIKNNLSIPGQLVKRENLETWHYGGRKILVGFVAVPIEQVPAALEAFRIESNQFIEETRRKRCHIMNSKGELIECPKCNKCDECNKKYDWNFEYISSRTISLDEQEENMNNPDKKGFDFSGSTLQDDNRMLAITLHDLICEIGIENNTCAEILELLYDGYTKAEILNKINYSKGKSQGYEYISKALTEAKEFLKNKGYDISDFIK